MSEREAGEWAGILVGLAALAAVALVLVEHAGRMHGWILVAIPVVVAVGLGIKVLGER